MGNQKLKWTEEEEEALLAGVSKHGPGKWKNILKDPEFAPYLTHRSNIDLKDKWRNLSVNHASQGSKEKSRTSKSKAIAVAQRLNIQNSAPATSLRYNASPVAVMDDPSNSLQDGKNVPRYNAMIFEALLTLKDRNGSDRGAILNFIEQRHEVPVPPNFRKLLTARLRRLVVQGKLEKVQNGYKIKKETPLGIRTLTPKQKVVRSRRSQNSGLPISSETVKDAADSAAYKVADAENKSFLAAEAVREAERISKMAEDTESMLQLMREIYEQCSRGEIVLLS
ncbi:hypothetical protein FNV43_RR06664 [Rhamnella rubrinervis]|uniref:MYB transcription factor n=1 Tax=Rhamnella rubrinervis TaxID=2594499 RepID=A0A8K0MM69_9ROSA|nr:hypothetical protein FNV43_RR06664 [Rhamnella rubrinervis]